MSDLSVVPDGRADTGVFCWWSGPAMGGQGQLGGLQLRLTVISPRCRPDTFPHRETGADGWTAPTRRCRYSLAGSHSCWTSPPHC